MNLISNYYKSEILPARLNDLRFFKHRFDRDNLVELLHEDNLNASKLVKDNIELLAEDETYVVITGQQLGLFGGPLYTFYKMLNTIQLCKEFKIKYPRKNFVPVFWLEAEDADIDEVSIYYKIFDNDLKKFQYLDSQKGAIGLRTIEQQINPIAKNLNNFSFSENDLWVESFKKFYQNFANEYGLVFFNPNKDSVRLKTKEFWNIIISKHSQLTDLIKSKSAEIKNTFSTLQVDIKEDETFLFKHTANGREKIKIIDNSLIDEKLSPNVLLRPLYQDFIFPSLAYIGGDAEIAYQMQLSEAYCLIERDQVILFPRTHLTILNSKTRRLLNQYDLEADRNYSEFLKDANKFKQLGSEAELKDSENSQFNDFELYLVKIFDLAKIENELEREKLKSAIKTRYKSFSEQFHKKILAVAKRKNSDQTNHIKYLLTILFPSEDLQERIFGVLQFTDDPLNLAHLIEEKFDLHIQKFQFIELEG